MMRASSSTSFDVLTDEQAALLEQYRSRWNAARLSTKPVDRPAAEEAVEMAYRAAGLALPDSIVWCGGPIEILRSRESVRRGVSIGAPVCYPLVHRMREQADRAIAQSSSPNAIARVCKGIDPVGPDVVSAAVKRVISRGVRRPGQSVWSRLRRTISSAMDLRTTWLGRQISDDFICSQEELGWLGAYEYLNDACGLKRETESLRGLCQIGANVGWIVPYANICWLAERHNIIQLDARGRLHCPTGPALAYPDGWFLHAWKGIEVPPGIIDDPRTITIAMIDRERDMFVRRCMIEILTPERFIAMGGASRVAQDECGILWRRYWGGMDIWTAVEVVNGTAGADGIRRRYFLQVPPDIRTARGAVAWTYGLSEERYAGLALRT
jgi:hypothetical protein